LGARLVFSLRSINSQDMPAASGARWLACAGVVAGISAVDAAGACMSRLGLDAPFSHGADREHASLAYHENVDQLSSVTPRGDERNATTFGSKG
jgi:hypothetical protein